MAGSRVYIHFTAAAVFGAAFVILTMVPGWRTPDSADRILDAPEANGGGRQLEARHGHGGVPASEEHVLEHDGDDLPVSLGEALQAARHRVWTVGNESVRNAGDQAVKLRAWNPGQGLRAAFGREGTTLSSSDGGKDWKVCLAPEGVPTLADPREEGARVEYRRPNLVEWYENRTDGIEHGFVIGTAPADDSGTIEVGVRVDGLRVEELAGREAGSSDLQFVDQNDQPVLAYTGLKVWDATGQDLVASMAPTASGLTISVEAGEAVYPLTIDPLITSFEGKLEPSVSGSGSELDQFGERLAIDGDVAVVGVLRDADLGARSGSAYVFERINGTWTAVTKLLASDGVASDDFGAAVAVDNGTILVGAPDAGSVGKAYVFEKSGGVWSEQAILQPAAGNSGDDFGISVSISGDTALIGASGDDGNGSSSGSAYVFLRSGAVWTEQQQLIPSQNSAGDRFGLVLDLDGDTAVCGVVSTYRTAAFVFVRSGTTWTEQAILEASDGPGDKFGAAVAISGDRVVAFHKSVSQGQVIAFHKDRSL